MLTRGVEVTATKLSAAVQQLDRACRLLYCERDLVCAHALAAAAHELLEGVARRASPRPLTFDLFLKRAPNQAAVAEALAQIKHPQNFLKHFNRDAEGPITLDDLRVETEIIIGAHTLAQVAPAEMTAPIRAALQLFCLRVGIDGPEMQMIAALLRIDPSAVTREIIGDLIRRLDVAK